MNSHNKNPNVKSNKDRYSIISDDITNKLNNLNEEKKKN